MKVMGELVSTLGSAMIVTGFITQAAVKVMTLPQALIGGGSTPTVASLFPGLPTWFIPESGPGFAFWLAVTAYGLLCKYLAKKLERMYY